jgi:hypothetical protein
MAYVAIPVLEEYLPEVYGVLARLSRADAESADTRPDIPEAEPSNELVIRMYRESEAGHAHQKLMDHLATVAENDGDRWVPSSELMQVLGKDRVQLRGVFGAFGRRANHRYGGAKPWRAKWDHNAGQYTYRVSAAVAGAIRQAQEVS